MGKVIKVSITDGRVVKGQLQCIDNSLNLIITDTLSLPEQQKLGPIMVPGEHIVACQLFIPLTDK